MLIGKNVIYTKPRTATDPWRIRRGSCVGVGLTLFHATQDLLQKEVFKEVLEWQPPKKPFNWPPKLELKNLKKLGWWLFDPSRYFEPIGPYDTKAEAVEDMRGLQRSWTDKRIAKLHQRLYDKRKEVVF